MKNKTEIKFSIGELFIIITAMFLGGFSFAAKFYDEIDGGYLYSLIFIISIFSCVFRKWKKNNKSDNLKINKTTK